MAKVICVKHFLKENTKPLPFPLRLITLRSSWVNLICSSAVKKFGSSFGINCIGNYQMGWLAGIIFTFSKRNVVYVKTCWEAPSLTTLLYVSRDNAISFADLWFFNTIDNHDAYASSEGLFELTWERDTVVVAYANCYCFSDIIELSWFSKLSDMFF